MISEILNGEFMDCRKVKEICMKSGATRSEIKEMKRKEGIKTIEVMNNAGEKLWLWFDPQQIWEKYHARKAD